MKKRAAPLLLAAMAALTLTYPAMAAEPPTPAAPAVLYPTEVLEYTAGGLDELRISKTYSYGGF